MDPTLCICMEKLCQCHHMRRTYSSRTTSPKITKYCIEIPPRMVVTTFNDNPSATLISCHSPTNVSEETELFAFYDELSSLARSIPKHNVLVIGGDMNAHIGENVNHKFNLHNSSNTNGKYLTEFPLENRWTFKKGRENYGPTHMQTILKQRWTMSL